MSTKKNFVVITSTMKNFIVFTDPVSGFDDEVYAVDTAGQILIAQRAMREHGIDSLPVLTGDAPDTVETRLTLLAAD